MASRLQDVILRGTAAAKPLATVVAPGTIYFSTDLVLLERSNGTIWETYSGVSGGGGGGGFSAGGIGLLLPESEELRDEYVIPGPVGQTGSAGSIGPRGLQGYNGLDGLDGEDGYDGVNGLIGPSGPTGLQGATGQNGPPGIDGEKGEDGLDGISIQGPPGPIGMAGNIGPAGIQGYNGLDGNDGEQGDMGVPGPLGQLIPSTKSFFIPATSLLPDTSGNVYPKPSLIDDTNDRFPHEILAFKDSGTKIGASATFTIPRGYINGLQFTVIWKATVTTGDVVWDLETFTTPVGSTLDPSTDTDALTVTTTTDGTARDRNDSTMTTTGTYVVNDLVQFKVSRDGVAAGDTMAAEALFEGILVQWLGV